MRRRDKTGDRRHVDDRAAAIAALRSAAIGGHRGDAVLAAQEYAFDIDRLDRPPLVEIRGGEMLIPLGRQDARIVDQDIRPAMGSRDLVHQRLPARLVAHIVLDELRVRAEHLGRALAALRIELRDRDLGALLGKPRRGREPDARARAGDDGNLAVYASHFPSPCRC